MNKEVASSPTISDSIKSHFAWLFRLLVAISGKRDKTFGNWLSTLNGTNRMVSSIKLQLSSIYRVMVSYNIKSSAGTNESIMIYENKLNTFNFDRDQKSAGLHCTSLYDTLCQKPTSTAMTHAEFGLLTSRYRLSGGSLPLSRPIKGRR